MAFLDSVVARARQQGLCEGRTHVAPASHWSTEQTFGMTVASGAFVPGPYLEAILQNHWLIVDNIGDLENDMLFAELLRVQQGRPVYLPCYDQYRIVQLVPARMAHRANAQAFIMQAGWRMVGITSSATEAHMRKNAQNFLDKSARIVLPLPTTRRLLQWLATQLDQHEMDREAPFASFMLNLVRAHHGLRRTDERALLSPALIRDLVGYAVERQRQDAPTFMHLLEESASVVLFPRLGIDAATVPTAIRQTLEAQLSDVEYRAIMQVGD